MTHVRDLAAFVHASRYEQLSEAAAEQLRIRVLDTLGVAIAAQGAAPMRAIRSLLADLGGSADATFIGGGRGPIDRVAFYNGALSRYLDYMDSYLAAGETNHPSDNLGAVLAAAESVDASGADLLAALAVCYQVQTRLSDVAPVRARGFDHTVQGAYAAAAGVSRALGLDREQTQNAISISGTANNALRVTRTGDLSHWKGLAYPNMAKEATFAALLAQRGLTGPAEVFEGNKGLQETITGSFEIDWSREDLEKVRETIVKKHNSEIHSQTALDAALEVRLQDGFLVRAIERVELRTFDVAHSIIGGGEEGDKRSIRTKEEADHSLPWLLAVALLDGQVEPEQYHHERIVADDVQGLMRRVHITPDADYSSRFPQEMVADLTVTLADGTVLTAFETAYEGFHTDPLDWAGAMRKYRGLALPVVGSEMTEEIADIVHELERHPVRRLTDVLSRAGSTH
ncbi:MmgE/PrpD family protein [Brachybacterium vulturis]|uniref:MmgE/PrpD family protein n=1 Tax=Brachybacterium vulturis TaxID=2017484 RepID=UPI0037356A7C